uniref:CD276 antigen homolog isoform X3 n=1 Tax=Scatophagus argus TaxID=75038 RepID=UPI001ED7D5D7|nr:CD276 antigen homolog isoform X3 [Scatophagus argus]
MIAKLQTLLFICISISSLAAGELRLMCPTQQVRATEGENATLPCHPDQRIDLSNHTVEWTKLNPEETVHVYRRRKDDPGPQSPQYKDRTTLNREDLKTGNLALHISSVNQSDSGTYRCVIPEEAEPCTVVLLIETQDQPGEIETTTRLLEEGKPRLMCPTERVRATEGESVTLLCHPDQRIDLSEDTVDWTVHVYQCGQDDLDPQSPQYRNRTTLNHEDLKTGNLTLHISSVNQSDNGTYRCVIPEEAKCCIVVLPVDGAKMEAAWIVISTGVVIAVALVLFILVKCGSTKICKTLEWMKGQEAEKANNGEMENLRTQTERRSSESAV